MLDTTEYPTQTTTTRELRVRAWGLWEHAGAGCVARPAREALCIGRHVEHPRSVALRAAPPVMLLTRACACVLARRSPCSSFRPSPYATTTRWWPQSCRIRRIPCTRSSTAGRLATSPWSRYAPTTQAHLGAWFPMGDTRVVPVCRRKVRATRRASWCGSAASMRPRVALTPLNSSGRRSMAIATREWWTARCVDVGCSV